MKNNQRGKKRMAILLTAALLVPNGAYAATIKDFSDFPNDWSHAALTQAVENGLLGGYDGKILPKGVLTRAEMATIINRAFGATEKASLNGYTDVAENAWYCDDMAKAVQMGTFVGGASGRLNPAQAITREEAFAVLARAFEMGTGNVASLEAYSDAKEVSPWARQVVAAMVEEGYVGGYDGKLAPKASITRAEFAAIMSKLVKTYVTEETTISHDVDGNMVVRTSGATLKDMTIDGDLILADGIGRGDVTLDHVTVNGRVIVRGGGTESVHLNGVTVKGQIIMNNRNAITALVEKDAHLNEVVLYSDAVLKGQFNKVTVAAPIDVNLTDSKITEMMVEAAAKNATIQVNKGSVVDTIQVKADGVVIDGKGKVNKVQADANHTKVLTQDSKVQAGAGTVGVMAGSVPVNPGSSVVVGSQDKPDGNHGGGTSGGGGSISGGDTDAGIEEGLTQGTLVKAEKAQIVQTDAGAWLPLVFVDGVDADDVRIFVDGKNITDAMSNVMTDGSVAKLPLVGNPGSVTVQNDQYTQTLQLGENSQPDAVYQGNDYLPDYFLAHGPIPVWDYHLTNYDDNGKVRVLPGVTTFGNKQAAPIHPVYSPVSVLAEGDKTGTVEMMFNYTSDADKAWFDSIAQQGALSLVSYDQYKTVLNKTLQYEKTTTSHHGKTVGVLKVPFGQSNFKNNGRYYVRVATEGNDGKTSYQLVPIHVVNHQAPTLNVTETPESGRNLHFELKHMVYGIADPIESVVLTKPSGKKVTLNKIDDYFLMSQEMFILYNDVNVANGTNHLDEIGNYTLSIQATGFQDFECTFNVGGGMERGTQARIASVDALSSATSGGSSGGNGESGGGIVVQANLLFDGDLLANALVLEKIGQETPAATTVLDYWKSNVTADAVFNKGDHKYYKWSDFISQMNKVQTKNQLWMPFVEYHQTATATVNPPHATKAVLEDGLLGELQDASVSGKLEAPSVKVTHCQQGENPVLTFEGAQAKSYLSKVTELHLNGDYRPLEKSLYTIDAEKGTITLKDKCMTVGKNVLVVQADGYKPNKVDIDYERQTETTLSLTAKATTEQVVLTVENSEGDFLRALQSVVLIKDGKEDVVYTEGGEGSDAVYYVLGKDYKTLTLHNVKAGDYTVQLKAADYHEALKTTFSVEGEDHSVPTPSVSTPQVEKVELVEGLIDQYYRVIFKDKNHSLDTYLKAVNSVTSEGSALKKSSSFSGNDKAYRMQQGDDYTGDLWYLQLSRNSIKSSGVTTIVVSAANYEDLTLTFNDGQYTGNTVVDPDVDTDDGGAQSGGHPKVKALEFQPSLLNAHYRLSFEKVDAELSTYLSKMTAITLDGQPLRLVSGFWNESLAYKMSNNDTTGGDNCFIDLSSDCIKADGSATLILKADGYPDQTLHIQDGALVQ